MDIMNLIHEICLLKSNINNTPKWKFITKNKLSKKLDEDITKFRELDIFRASENIISFLLSLNRDTTKHISGEQVLYNYTYLALDIKMGENAPIINVLYFPKSNTFDIKGNNISYTIYPKTRLGKRLSGMWNPLSYKIKERYIEIIIQMADEIDRR